MDGHLGQAGHAARAARASSTAGSRRCSTTRCSTSSPRASAAARWSTRCSPSGAPALPERLDALRAAADPAALRDAAHALRSPSAGFGIARLAARLRVVETAARAGRMAPLDAVLAAAAQADAALATKGSDPFTRQLSRGGV